MKRLALVILLAGVSTISYADDQVQKNDLPRYQIVSTSEGLHSIFRVDTVTGEVSYCYVVSDSNDFNAPLPSCDAYHQPGNVTGGLIRMSLRVRETIHAHSPDTPKGISEKPFSSQRRKERGGMRRKEASTLQ